MKVWQNLGSLPPSHNLLQPRVGSGYVSPGSPDHSSPCAAVCPAGRSRRRKRRKRMRRRKRKKSPRASLHCSGRCGKWDTTTLGCPQKIPSHQCNVPPVLPLYGAALKPLLHANAQSQAAFCVGISRKLISALCQMWVCGRAPAFSHRAGTELLIRSSG